MRSIRDLAVEALAVQDACNLSGVAHSFARAMSDLLAHDLSTDQANAHPIAVVWADKIADLVGLPHDYTVAGAAFHAVHDLAR